ncbi:MAG: DUF4860 domain-containing protein [Clostridiales bacterium]|nr:DUF4860 domain-containing protein [Clostridiales bacterium]
MRKFRNKKGYTEAELMMVFALLALFGILCFTLIQAGSGAYDRLSENHSNKSYARITLSYVENRIRQGDEKGNIKLVPHPENEQEYALVISNATDVEGEDLWIMQHKDELVEYYVYEGQEVQLDNYLKIGDVYHFGIQKVGNALRVEVQYLVSGEIASQIKIIALRTGGGK